MALLPSEGRESHCVKKSAFSHYTPCTRVRSRFKSYGAALAFHEISIHQGGSPVLTVRMLSSGFFSFREPAQSYFILLLLNFFTGQDAFIIFFGFLWALQGAFTTHFLPLFPTFFLFIIHSSPPLSSDHPLFRTSHPPGLFVFGSYAVTCPISPSDLQTRVLPPNFSYTFQGFNDGYFAWVHKL